MPVKFPCPHCGRSLEHPGNAGKMTCDGCEGSINLDALHYRCAGLLRRAIGLVIILCGASLGVMPLLRSLALIGVASGPYFAMLGVRIVFSLLIIAWGISTCKGKWVVEQRALDPYDVFTKSKGSLPEL